MRTLITGANGQLGRALLERLPHAIGVARPEVDVTDLHAMSSTVAAHRPELILHCAALTNVDGAAENPLEAYRVNGLGTQAVALAAARVGAGLVYISTNEVFDGESDRPYAEFDPTRPINPYGASKLAGEQFALQLAPQATIIRTSWVTGRGGRNFVHRIQQLADERGALKVVTDESANPTFVPDLADAIVTLVTLGRPGVYHLTNAGYVSRFDFARAILDLTGRGHIPLEPITRADFNRPSTPPRFAALANYLAAGLGVTLPPWQNALADFLRAER